MESSNQFLGTERIGKLMQKYAIPCIISLLVGALYNIVDQIFIANASYLGSYGNAANTVVFPLTVVALAIAVMIGDGCCAFVSISLGQNEVPKAKRSVGNAVVMCLVSSIVLAALYLIFADTILAMFGGTVNAETYHHSQEYFFYITLGVPFYMFGQAMNPIIRADGNPRFAMISTLAGAVLNIILDPIFIMPWGLGMGAAGAGLATFISNCVACLYFLVLIAVRRGRTYVCVDIRKLSFSRRIVRAVCGVGIPAAMQNLLNVTGMTILNNFTSAYQAEAIAAMGIAQKINMLPMYVSLGLSQGVMPLISYTYSSGNDKRMKDSVSFTGVASVIIIAVVSVVYFIFPGFFISLFMDSDVIVNYGSHFLRGMSIAGPFMCIDFLAVGVFQAVGMGREALIFAILRKIVLEIPALWILNILFPLYGLAYAQSVAEFVLSIVAIIVMSRLFKRLARQRQEKKA